MKEKTYLERYEEALAKRYKVGYQAVSGESFIELISKTKNHEVVNISTYNHAMLLYKENNNLYFFDPNEQTGGGFLVRKTADEIKTMIVHYCTDSEKQFDHYFLSIQRLDVSFPESLRRNKPITLSEAEEKKRFSNQNIPQNDVVIIINTLIRKIYDLNVPDEAGACFGLCMVLRELLAQTGSVSVVLYRNA